MRKISESTVRRLSLSLRFLEQFDAQGQTTIPSAELARRGGTTSAQVRKDLSFFGSFGKRGLGYSVPELTARIRDILGLRRTYRVVLVGAGRIGSALVQYPGFRQRGFHVAAIYDKRSEEHTSELQSPCNLVCRLLLEKKKKKKHKTKNMQMNQYTAVQHTAH